VLTLVRDGLTNQQIAERLGVTRDAAKYHVGEILSKLHLSTREEAAAWQPEHQVQPSRRPAWASALGPIAGLWRAWPIAARIAGATVVAGAVVGVGVLAYGVARSSGDDDGVHPTATAASTATASVNAAALTVLPAISLPPNLSIVIEVGCCETPLTGLVRANGENQGAGVRKVLFSAGSHSFNTADGSFDSRDEYEANGVTLPTPNPQAPGKAPAEDRPYVATYGVSADAQAMVVGLCIRGSCEGVNAAPNDQGITQLYRSLDRGDTWSELAQLGPYVRIVGVTSAGRTLIANNVLDTKEEVFSWQPDGEAVPLPSSTSGMPTVLSDGRLIWPSLGNWYLQDGSVLAQDVPATSSFNSIIDMGDGRFAVNTTDGFAIVENGTSETYPAGVAAYLGDGQFVGMTSVAAPAGSGLVSAEVPALIDINARTITPITSPFLDVGFDSPGFNIIAGAYLIASTPTGL
jgi:hypothetical protein